MTQPEPAYPEPGSFRLSGAVFARRDGNILLLKRGAGAMTGAWYLPGGAVDEGETPEQGALRELLEEAGLVPSGPLTLIGAVPMHVYGANSVQFVYACDCPDGEVVISHEHTAFRWLDPRDYRDRYFGPEQLALVAQGDPRTAAIVTGVRQNLDEYIAWLDHHEEDRRLRELVSELEARAR
ncbi:MAG: NUDIX hydrolase [Dehalococcoidia bacterium]